MDDGLEARIQQRCQAQDFSSAATLIVEQYGPPILAFLVARLRNQGDADEVFAGFTERLWLGLPGFQWRCSVKSWAYMVARNLANDFKTAAHNRVGRHEPLSKHPSLARAVDRVRTTTRAHLRTANRQRMRELRENLPQDDQMLLILRIDQNMTWTELAIALSDGHEPPQGQELARQAARLRKRFERTKRKLRHMAQEAGLVPG